MEQWKDLILENDFWPEKGKIYCDGCGRKNRGDDGWIWIEGKGDRDWQLRNARVQYRWMRMDEVIDMPPLQKGQYLCEECNIPKKLNDQSLRFSDYQLDNLAKPELIKYCKFLNIDDTGDEEKLINTIKQFYNLK